jgi:hypothetical protein
MYACHEKCVACFSDCVWIWWVSYLSLLVSSLKAHYDVLTDNFCTQGRSPGPHGSVGCQIRVCLQDERQCLYWGTGSLYSKGVHQEGEWRIGLRTTEKFPSPKFDPAASLLTVSTEQSWSYCDTGVPSTGNRVWEQWNPATISAPSAPELCMSGNTKPLPRSQVCIRCLAKCFLCRALFTKALLSGVRWICCPVVS